MPCNWCLIFGAAAGSGALAKGLAARQRVAGTLLVDAGRAHSTRVGTQKPALVTAVPHHNAP